MTDGRAAAAYGSAGPWYEGASCHTQEQRNREKSVRNMKIARKVETTESEEIQQKPPKKKSQKTKGLKKGDEKTTEKDGRK